MCHEKCVERCTVLLLSQTHLYIKSKVCLHELLTNTTIRLCERGLDIGESLKVVATRF